MPKSFLAALLAGGILLVATAIPGVFTVDEDHYLVSVLALREGRLTAPGTEGLPASPSLLYFDPGAGSREVTRTPVSPTVPPLYAALALPFSALGWRGLQAMNVLAFLGTAALCFAYARRHADARAGWLAAGAFALGGFALEYAQGMWPHMLAVFLCTAGFVLASRLRDGAGPAVAVAAGLVLGLAAGVRYQNVVFAACVGAGILLLGPRRLRHGAAFAAGLALPLLASSLINHARLEIWNPVSKGGTYARVGHAPRVESNKLTGAVQMGLGRVVDFSRRPDLPEYMRASHAYMAKEPTTGAFLIGDAMKKAWLQSSPWLAVPLAALAMACLGWARRAPLSRRRREMVALALPVGAVVGLFAVAGVARTDGLCFNQRYLMELGPLAAVGLAWALHGRALEPASFAAGAAAALAAASATTWILNDSRWEVLLVMNVPLLLGAALAVAWIRSPRAASPLALSVCLGACLGWALGVHVGEDWRVSREFRHIARAHAAALERALPDRAAVVSVGGDDDYYGPLQMHRDLVIVDPRLDWGESAPAMVSALLDQRRRVFVVANAMPRELLERMAAGRPVRRVPPSPVREGRPDLYLLEILPAPVGARGDPGDAS